MSLERVALAAGIAGAALMIAFDDTLTRILGVAGLLTFVVAGLVAIANPGYLGRTGDDDGDDAEGRV
jgi:hypothetical protein